MSIWDLELVFILQGNARINCQANNIDDWDEWLAPQRRQSRREQLWTFKELFASTHNQKSFISGPGTMPEQRTVLVGIEYH